MVKSVIFFLAMIAAPPVFAHHAFQAEFDDKKPVHLVGKVTKMEWINPHAWIHIDVTDAEGRVTSWMIECGSPNIMLRRGFTKESLEFGSEIVQGPGYVVIRNEMIHEARVIPLNGRPHTGSTLRTYMGDSRGHWEGNTLVVETVNFNDQTGAAGGFFSDAAKLTERFTRIAADELSYDLTIDDPKTWTRPWTIHMPYKLDPGYTIYEYACHEGNYMMSSSLEAARQLEKEGKATRVDRGEAGGPAR